MGKILTAKVRLFSENNRACVSGRLARPEFTLSVHDDDWIVRPISPKCCWYTVKCQIFCIITMCTSYEAFTIPEICSHPFRAQMIDRHRVCIKSSRCFLEILDKHHRNKFVICLSYYAPVQEEASYIIEISNLCGCRCWCCCESDTRFWYHGTMFK